MSMNGPLATFTKMAVRQAILTVYITAAFASECPDISGTWLSSDNSPITITQSGCSIGSHFGGNNHDHELGGAFNKPASFRYSVVRAERGGKKCKTVMDGMFIVAEDAQTMRSEIIGTDGKCDLGANFKETLYWRKEDR